MTDARRLLPEDFALRVRSELAKGGCAELESGAEKQGQSGGAARRHVFIVGSKGIPARYGGFETFVENLTRHGGEAIQYHVACIGGGAGEFSHNGARCHRFRAPDIGAAKAIFYDAAALSFFIGYCEKNEISSPVFYILACRIGIFIARFRAGIKRIGGVILVNPDGHEWKRAKWPKPVRAYWKYSERKMVECADLVVCDSVEIEKYIKSEYAGCKPRTAYIAYGADVGRSRLADGDAKFARWLEANAVEAGGYYLAVGRLVPENNFEAMIRGFMASKTKRSFVLVTESRGRYLDRLDRRLRFRGDGRVKFAGPEYDAELLKKIRENAFAYIHGHEVGGTNPSLLEAMASTGLNLLLDVPFNREVAMDSALYWDKADGSLPELIDAAELLGGDAAAELGCKSKLRISSYYSWNSISLKYISLFSEIHSPEVKA
ncbi:MAG: DUF1972 domain-containing protein [Clostridiales bacterium]|jgi:rhamnosyltransferase|nr:DUF1972 domain-containing protein [Clostridiales bacterium]